MATVCNFNGSEWMEVNQSLYLSFHSIVAVADRLVECVGNGEDFCTITSSRHLRSDAKLHYCCKVTTSTDPSNSIQSPPFAIKVEAGRLVGIFSTF